MNGKNLLVKNLLEKMKNLLEKFFGRKNSRKIVDQSLAEMNIFSTFSKHWLKWPPINLNRPKNCFYISIWRKNGAVYMENLKKFSHEAYKKNIGKR
jgi:hypothetical protein